MGGRRRRALGGVGRVRARGAGGEGAFAAEAGRAEVAEFLERGKAPLAAGCRGGASLSGELGQGGGVLFRLAFGLDGEMISFGLETLGVGVAFWVDHEGLW